MDMNNNGPIKNPVVNPIGRRPGQEDGARGDTNGNSQRLSVGNSVITRVGANQNMSDFAAPPMIVNPVQAVKDRILHGQALSDVSQNAHKESVGNGNNPLQAIQNVKSRLTTTPVVNQPAEADFNLEKESANRPKIS